MKTSKGFKAIKKVAEQKGISVAKVRKEIEIAIDMGIANPDPAIQAYWANIPRKSEKPTPEEVIVYMAKRVKSDRQLQGATWKH